MSGHDDFEAIAPAAVSVTLAGHSFAVSPITVERLPAFARALRPVMPLVSELAALTEESDTSYVADTLLALVSEHGELMAEAVAVAVAADRADIPAQRARIAKLDAADFLQLALPVVRVNADFFARRLLPLLLRPLRLLQLLPRPLPATLLPLPPSFR